MFIDAVVVSGLIIVALIFVFFAGLGIYSYKEAKEEEAQ